MSEPRFSIISCFYNSTHRLEAYFAALEQLQFDPGSVEFLFVDNASRDDTGSQLRSRAARLKAPAHILSETTPGLMHARCTGVAAATGEYVLFLDDDNEPEPNYLRELERLLLKFPSAVSFTGNAVLPADYPVHDGNRGALGYLIVRELPGEFAFTLDSFHPPHGPWGAGLFSRRTELWQACQEWQRGDKKITGRAGGNLTGGEDIWLIHRLTRENRQVVFSDRLRMIHRMDRSRLQSAYLGRLGWENGVGHLAVVEAVRELKPNLREPVGSTWHQLKSLFLRVPYRLGRCWLRRDATTFLEAATALGYAYAWLSRRLR